MFIPLQVRQDVIALSYSFYVDHVDIKETLKWISYSMALSRVVLNANFERKLVKKKIVRICDWRKVNKLFMGWGENRLGCGKLMEEVSMKVSEGRLVYWVNKEALLRRNLNGMKDDMNSRFVDRKDLLVEIGKIKVRAVEREWRRYKGVLGKKYQWLVSKGGGREIGHEQQDKSLSVKKDSELIEKFGNHSVEPVVYGGMSLGGDEKKVLSLPPKYAFYEKLNFEDLRLEVRKAGVKMRWSERQKKEEFDLEQDIRDSTAYIKGCNSVDFSRTRVTSFKDNRRVIVPGPVKEGTFEAKWMNAEIRCEEVAASVQSQLGRRFGTKRKLLDVEESLENGLRSLKRKRARGAVFFQTDKSGKMSVDCMENFAKKMEPHVDCGREVEMETVENTEKEMNVKSRVWARMFCMGTQWNQWDRVKEAVSTTSCLAPPLYGLPKDHKVVGGGLEHPLRPVCGANTGPGSRISDILSRVIEPFCDEFAGVSMLESTEDLQARIVAVNELDDEDRSNLSIVSMDATALFPSLSIEKSADAVRKIVEESSLVIEKFNHVELVRYLPYLLGREEIENLGFRDLVMTRVRSGGRNPTITGEELMLSWEERSSKGKSLWKCATRSPNQDELRSMVAVALGAEVKQVMSKHLFRFMGVNYMQKEGGSIGSQLTCTVSKVRMIFWAREMRTRCLRLGLRLLLDGVYVDDTFYAVKTPARGYRVDPESEAWVFSQHQLDEDLELQDDELSARVLVQIANAIDTDIQMKYEVPSGSANGFMAVLDIQAKVENNRILFRYFEKSMTSPFVIMKQSALSWNTKKMALVGEVFRRIINTSPELVQSGEVQEDIDWIQYKMMLSGYSVEERDMVTRLAWKRYNNILQDVREGKRPLYRASTWEREARAVGKLKKQREWSGDVDAVLFCQITPDSLLKTELERVFSEEGLKVKVVEKGGSSVLQFLQKSDVCADRSCEFDDCPVCLTKPLGLCSRESVG